MNSIQWILLILCIAAIMLYFKALTALPAFPTHPPSLSPSFVYSGAVEGYRGPVEPVQGAFPRAGQVSMIPQDAATATTANPQLAKPDYRDWIDARDAFTLFLEIYRPATLPPVGDPEREGITTMFLQAPLYIKQIDTYIQKPEAVPSRILLDQAKEARRYANRIRQVVPADPNTGDWERPGCISHIGDNLLAL